MTPKRLLSIGARTGTGAPLSTTPGIGIVRRCTQTGRISKLFLWMVGCWIWELILLRLCRLHRRPHRRLRRHPRQHPHRHPHLLHLPSVNCCRCKTAQHLRRNGIEWCKGYEQTHSTGIRCTVTSEDSQRPNVYRMQQDSAVVAPWRCFRRHGTALSPVILTR